MARWDINKNRGSVKVVYTNSMTGQKHNCGDQHPDTSMRLIMEWAAEQADPGDFLMMNGRFVAQKFPEAQA
jgi:hypothetical protein